MRSRSLRCLFVVQGEGRGHMTQALALEEMLLSRGHRVARVLVGRSEHRPLPDFFLRRISAPVRGFPSPVLAPDRRREGVSPARTVAHTVSHIPEYARGVRRVFREIARIRPDVVVNFFDLLAGLTAPFRSFDAPVVAIAHHFVTSHPDGPGPPGGFLESGPAWAGFRALCRVNAAGASRVLALSLRPLPPSARAPLRVVPPLLRKEVRGMRPAKGDHLLIYLLNPGYARSLEAWHQDHRDVPLHGFWDRTDVPETVELHPNLVFHRLDDRKFLELLRTCRGYASTAGFESICEAMYLGKPVLMVPTGNHVEQRLNARDAVSAGAGIRRESFDLDALLEYLPRHRAPGPEFRRWVDGAEDRIVREIEEAARYGAPPSVRRG